MSTAFISIPRPTPRRGGGNVSVRVGGLQSPSLAWRSLQDNPLRSAFSYWKEREAGKARGGNGVCVCVTKSLGVPLALGERKAHGGREGKGRLRSPGPDGFSLRIPVISQPSFVIFEKSRRAGMEPEGRRKETLFLPPERGKRGLRSLQRTVVPHRPPEQILCCQFVSK